MLEFSTPTQSGLVGRPSFRILVERIQVLRDGLCFRWTDITRILGVFADHTNWRSMFGGILIYEIRDKIRFQILRSIEDWKIQKPNFAIGSTLIKNFT